jgi:hypothetical protein
MDMEQVLDELDEFEIDSEQIAGFKLLTSKERLAALPSIAPEAYLQLESLYFQNLSNWVSKYSGGHHDMLRYPNGAITLLFEALNEEKVRVSNPSNGFEGFMTWRAVSVCAFIVALNQVVWMMHHRGKSFDKPNDAYHQLMQVAHTHEMFEGDRQAIFRLLD